MYLNITTRANDRKYLSIVHGYRDEYGKVKKKTIKSLGYLDELQKKYDDPISYFKSIAKDMDEKRKLEQTGYSISINKNEKLLPGFKGTKNFGYAALVKVYHELGINNFIKNRQRHTNDNFDANAIMQLIAYVHLISNHSDKSSFSSRHLLFEKNNYTEKEFYQSLMFLYKHKTNLQTWLNEEMKIYYDRDDTLIYYNIHNYCSPSHVIKIGVFTDENNIPVTYELFPCTSNYSSAYRPDFAEIKSAFKMNRMITVSDKAILNGDSIWKIINTPSNDGYIFNIPVHSTCRELKQYILNEEEYEWVNGEYKRKSRISSRAIEITLKNGEKTKKIIEEKQIVFYSNKYAKRAKSNAFDGYYVLFTSELHQDDDKIINTYRNLWNIERRFRLTRSTLEIRPEHISVHHYIEMHLTKCFMSYILIKMLEIKLDCKYDAESIIDSISSSTCININENLYILSYYDEVLKDIGEKTGIPFDNKIMSLQNIKNILSNAKK